MHKAITDIEHVHIHEARKYDTNKKKISSKSLMYFSHNGNRGKRREEKKKLNIWI